MTNIDAFFIDLDKTILEYDDESLDEAIILDWLKSLQVRNPDKILFSHDWPKINRRIEYFGIPQETYFTEWEQKYGLFEMAHKVKHVQDERVKLKNGAKDFLLDLNIPIALVSNSDPKVIDYMLNHFGIADMFQYIFRRQYNIENIQKPNPLVAISVANALGLNSFSTIGMIGDSAIDMRFARNSGLIAINLFDRQTEFDFYFTGFVEMTQYFKANQLQIFKKH